ncbi:MAG: hypothetical protein QOD77_2082 [Thermoplasmata archaeon]|jgi:hypothetical protein|nr:hypothetical protein [Thermoplasmata archaeon]
MRTLAFAFVAVAALLLAGCAANSTRTVTKTVTTTVFPDEPTQEQSPSIAFNKQSNPSAQGGTLTVVAVQGPDPWDIPWSDIRVRDADGEARCTVPTGMVRAGDVLTCTTDGPHSITYVPQNTLLYVGEF